MSGITVDEIYYDVAVMYPSLKRDFSIITGDAEGVAITKRKIRDVLGTQFEYEMQLNAKDGKQSDYDALYEVLTDPDAEYHTITLPYGQSTITYQAVIESGSDTYAGFYEGEHHWGDLTLRFVPMEPQKTST